MNATIKAERRRGAALEEAILTAAWDALIEDGFTNLTLEAVAKRAGTSRPVLHRRWPGRAELARAAILHHVTSSTRFEPRDLGNVRDELAALLRHLSARGTPIVIKLMLNMNQYFAETDSSFADLRSNIAGHSLIEKVLQRGIARGEIDPEKLTPRIASLPMDLLRHDVIMTLKPIPDAVIMEILDDIFLPLVMRQAPQPRA
jgi:AcrR family transcriptional regulator